MLFDAIDYLNQEGIYYRTSGENCANNHVVIDCPFCGNDTGQHLGIDLESGAWGCWRDESHRGKSPLRLVKALSNCSTQEARALLGWGDGPNAAYNQEFTSLIDDPKAFFDAEEEVDDKKHAKTLDLPYDCKPLELRKNTERFYDYLIDRRGFREEDIDEVVETYDLHYSLDFEGDQYNRIVLPVYMRNRLVAYTGRHIGKSGLRYKSTKSEESVISIYDAVAGYDELRRMKGKILFICEGPLDYMKVDFYCRMYGCRATCIFSKHVSDAQVQNLGDVLPNFELVVILLDPEEIYDSMVLETKLRPFGNVIIGELPKGVEDPGAMSARKVRQFTKNMLTKVY